MSHPVYGIGTSALVYIGDEVSDRADGVPIGKVIGITDFTISVDCPAKTDDYLYYQPAELCLVKRAEP